MMPPVKIYGEGDRVVIEGHIEAETESGVPITFHDGDVGLVVTATYDEDREVWGVELKPEYKGPDLVASDVQYGRHSDSSYYLVICMPHGGRISWEDSEGEHEHYVNITGE
jgi:ribosomal protein L21E